MECSCGFDKQPWAEVELSVPTLVSEEGAEELFESLSGLRGVRGVKVKTVELIVEERPIRKPRFRDEEVIPVSVAYGEVELRNMLRTIRARWDPRVKLWFVAYGLIRGTPLEARIAADKP